MRLCFASLKAIWPTLLALPLSAASVSAKTWQVLQGGTGDAPTIQAAFDSSAVGDSIVVGPGTYPGLIAAMGGRTLIGSSGAGATIIDAGGETTCLYGLPSDFSLLIEGFTFYGSESSYGFSGSFDVSFAGPGATEIRACILSGENGAIYTGADTRVRGCEIRNGGGIFFEPDSYGASLLIEDSLFENNASKNHDGEAAIVQIIQRGGPLAVVDVRNCIFRHNSSGPYDRPLIGFDYPFYYATLEFEMVGCLIHENEGAAVGHAPLSVTKHRGGLVAGGEEVYIHNNTIVQSGGLELHELAASPTQIYVERNLITGCPTGVVMPTGASLFHIACNNVWGNLVNWTGISDPTGINGNTSLAPLYCNPESDVFTLAANSPCLPENSECGILVGALIQGCGTVSVESKSWGQIKGLYR